ncbi:hypothetical protein D3C80_1384480 [compost metagenome]
MVRANCWYILPEIPGTKLIGMNTAARISAIAITGPEISLMAWRVASFAFILSWSILCCTASTTTMASSTTIPMASTKANMVRVLTVKPSGIKTRKVPMIDTGIASNGMSVALQFCRKRNTTNTTSNRASMKVCNTSSIEAFTTVAFSVITA